MNTLKQEDATGVGLNERVGIGKTERGRGREILKGYMNRTDGRNLGCVQILGLRADSRFRLSQKDDSCLRCYIRNNVFELPMFSKMLFFSFLLTFLFSYIYFKFTNILFLFSSVFCCILFRFQVFFITYIYFCL